ncbi:MAG TPA: metallophosphoesterase family protein [Terriglobia bacterium]|nr:metallophosphoesterase family protein [Terriglobia bacterium]
MTHSKAIIGVISDTHGLLRPEVKKVFKGVDLILHAGDIGAPEVLEELKSWAPVAAVRGNNDKGKWAGGIPETEVVQVGSIYLYLLHDVKELDLSPAAAGFQVVISGHSHKPSIYRRDGVLYVNPGSAGPRRFALPVTVARLTVEESTVEGKLVSLS